MTRLIITSFIAATCAIGCAATANTESPPGPDVPKVGDDGHQPAAAVVAPVWKNTSRRIEVSSFGYWEGSTGYAKDRAALTAAQLTALAGLRTISPSDHMAQDLTAYEVRVLDDDGSVETYRAADENFGNSLGEKGDALRQIDFDSLKPFLATTRCLRARKVNAQTRTAATPLRPSEADMSQAVAFPTDEGCINGIYAPFGCSDSLLTFDVTSKTTYDFVGGPCRDDLRLRVYAADGTTLVAESSPGTTDSCFSLRHTFDAGLYSLVLSKTTAASCTDNGACGDTSLRLRKVSD